VLQRLTAIEPNIFGLVVFAIAWLTGCVGFVYLSGTLPLRAAPSAVQSGFGPMLVWINVAVFLSLVVLTLVFAIDALRWTSLVVAGGFIFLFAPFIVQDLPKALKDTQAGLLVLLVVGLLAGALVYVMGR
jgi:hypothetical protein